MKEKEFREIYMQHYRLVVRVAYSVLHNSADAQDVASEVFLKLLECLIIKRDIHNMESWLCIVAKYTAYDFLRAKKNEVPIEDMEYNLHSKDFVSRLNNRLATESMIEDLYFKNRKWHDILLLHSLLGMSTKEIASMYKCSETAVSNCIYRAKKYLKKKYDYYDVVTFSSIYPVFILITISCAASYGVRI